MLPLPFAFNPLTPLLFLEFLDGVFSTLNELGFVVRVIIFSYLTYWMYITFRDVQTIFGLSVIITGYLIFIHSLSITLLTVIFFVFVIFGNMLQMILMFGVLPLFGYSWTMREYMKTPTSGETAEMQANAMRKLEAGQELSREEAQMMQAQEQAQQAQGQMGAANGSMPQMNALRAAM